MRAPGVRHHVPDGGLMQRSARETRSAPLACVCVRESSPKNAAPTRAELPLAAISPVSSYPIATVFPRQHQGHGVIAICIRIGLARVPGDARAWGGGQNRPAGPHGLAVEGVGPRRTDALPPPSPHAVGSARRLRTYPRNRTRGAWSILWPLRPKRRFWRDETAV